jgi:hypothetical protein
MISHMDIFMTSDKIEHGGIAKHDIIVEYNEIAKHVVIVKYDNITEHEDITNVIKYVMRYVNGRMCIINSLLVMLIENAGMC